MKKTEEQLEAMFDLCKEFNVKVFSNDGFICIDDCNLDEMKMKVVFPSHYAEGIEKAFIESGRTAGDALVWLICGSITYRGFNITM